MTGRSAGQGWTPRHSQSEWLTEAYKLLADGEWHDREEIVRKVMPTIPPGVAWRHNEQIRVQGLITRKRRELSPEEFAEWQADPANLERDPRRSIDLEGQIRSGRRALIMRSLQVTPSKGDRQIELRRVNGRVEVRRKPLAKQSLAAQTRAAYLKEHPEAKGDEVALRRAVDREAARRRTARLRAQGWTRDTEGNWLPPEQ